MLTNLLRGSPPEPGSEEAGSATHDDASRSSIEDDGDGFGDGDATSGSRLAPETSRLETVPELDERTPLLSSAASKQGSERGRRGLGDDDLEAQGAWRPSALGRLGRETDQ